MGARPAVDGPNAGARLPRQLLAAALRAQQAREVDPRQAGAAPLEPQLPAGVPVAPLLCQRHGRVGGHALPLCLSTIEDGDAAVPHVTPAGDDTARGIVDLCSAGGAAK